MWCVCVSVGGCTWCARATSVLEMAAGLVGNHRKVGCWVVLPSYAVTCATVLFCRHIIHSP